jgi:transaldolase
MEIWLDSTSEELAKKAKQLGIVHGVTTNPALIRRSGKPIESILESLLALQLGPVTAQVTADEADGMIEQALRWSQLSERILIKIPVVQAGIEAMGQLTQEGVPTMATVVFHPHQALLAAVAGASYVAPYVTRMHKMGIDSQRALATMKNIFIQYQFKTKLLAASISSLEQITQCAEMGIDAITLKDALFEAFMADNPHTLAALPM